MHKPDGRLNKYLPEISERTDRKIQNFIFGRKSSLISDRSWFCFLDASWRFIYILAVYIPFTLSANSVKTDLKKMDRRNAKLKTQSSAFLERKSYVLDFLDLNQKFVSKISNFMSKSQRFFNLKAFKRHFNWRWRFIWDGNCQFIDIRKVDEPTENIFYIYIGDKIALKILLSIHSLVQYHILNSSMRSFKETSLFSGLYGHLFWENGSFWADLTYIRESRGSMEPW